MIYDLDNLLKTFDDMSDIDIRGSVGEAISFVQAVAKSNCPVGPSGGELRERTFYEVRGGQIEAEGYCYNNAAHGPFVEFGTGPKGQADHDGISPEVSVAYTQNPWWIHESQISPETAEYYKFFYIDTKAGRFYRSYGQAAQPFMYPALADHIDDAVKIIAEELKRKL